MVEMLDKHIKWEVNPLYVSYNVTARSIISECNSVGQRMYDHQTMWKASLKERRLVFQYIGRNIYKQSGETSFISSESPSGESTSGRNDQLPVHFRGQRFHCCSRFSCFRSQFRSEVPVCVRNLSTASNTRDFPDNIHVNNEFQLRLLQWCMMHDPCFIDRKASCLL